MSTGREEKEWPDTEGKQAPSQPGPTNANPNEDAGSEGTHGDGPAPSTGNQQGGGTGDGSGAPA